MVTNTKLFTSLLEAKNMPLLQESLKNTDSAFDAGNSTTSALYSYPSNTKNRKINGIKVEIIVGVLPGGGNSIYSNGASSFVGAPSGHQTRFSGIFGSTPTAYVTYQIPNQKFHLKSY